MKRPAPVADQVLTREECAEYARFSVGALKNLAYRGEGPPMVKLGRSVRYRRSDVDKWLQRNLVGN